jgi:hypothetical protein
MAYGRRDLAYHMPQSFCLEQTRRRAGLTNVPEPDEAIGKFGWGMGFARKL